MPRDTTPVSRPLAAAHICWPAHSGLIDGLGERAKPQHACEVGTVLKVRGGRQPQRVDARLRAEGRAALAHPRRHGELRERPDLGLLVARVDGADVRA